MQVLRPPHGLLIPITSGRFNCESLTLLPLTLPGMNVMQAFNALPSQQAPRVEYVPFRSTPGSSSIASVLVASGSRSRVAESKEQFGSAHIVFVCCLLAEVCVFVSLTCQSADDDHARMMLTTVMAVMPLLAPGRVPLMLKGYFAAIKQPVDFCT